MAKDKTRLPFYPMYAADFQASQSVELMSLAERGLYISLLNRSWLGDGLPDDISQIQRLAQATDAEFSEAWPRVSQHFPLAGDGRRRNPRQEQVRADAAEAHQKRVNAANTRWRGDAKHDAKHVQPQPQAQPDSQSEVESHAHPENARAGLSDLFMALWGNYPKKVRQASAAKAYHEVITSPELHAEVMNGLQRWIESDQWHESLQQDGGRFIPDLDRFIVERRWNDCPPKKRGGWFEDDPFEEAKKR